ncbi:MAG: hypothetical protein FWE56_02865 [Candidatus Bathyarchaeota archaeon]|nr:hypothetical protein [Candidatus Termiticorpusculum sp.]MCL2868428.1 hypothetical protein [Candidatus Termiticorpusculum sp.]
MVETKNVTIALGVICLILAASLTVVVIANENLFGNQQNTLALENQISGLNAQASTLQNQIDDLNNELYDYETHLYDYAEQIAALTNKTTAYANIIDLKESHVILDNQTYTQDANTKTTLFNDKVNYAGYFEIQVGSTSDTTYLQVSYTHSDLKFDQTITIGTDGVAHFPILPGTIEILLGNTASTETNEVTVTLTYVY